ncbi:hypothetical protein D9M70_231470 [compost metagenome]
MRNRCGPQQIHQCQDDQGGDDVPGNGDEGGRQQGQVEEPAQQGDLREQVPDAGEGGEKHRQRYLDACQQAGRDQHDGKRGGQVALDVEGLAQGGAAHADSPHPQHGHGRHQRVQAVAEAAHQQRQQLAGNQWRRSIRYGEADELGKGDGKDQQQRWTEHAAEAPVRRLLELSSGIERNGDGVA